MSIFDVLTSKKTETSEGSEAPKATELLKKDHDAVKALFRVFRGLDDHDQQEKRRLFTEIERELTVHARVEEEIFYPAVKSGSSDEGEDLVLEANEEHAIVKTLLSQISALSDGDPRFDAKMKVLMESVEHHADEEESELFDEANLLGSDKLRELGRRMQERKMQLGGGKGDGETRKSASAGEKDVEFKGEPLKKLGVHRSKSSRPSKSSSTSSRSAAGKGTRGSSSSRGSGSNRSKSSSKRQTVASR